MLIFDNCRIPFANTQPDLRLVIDDICDIVIDYHVDLIKPKLDFKHGHEITSPSEKKIRKQ